MVWEREEGEERKEKSYAVGVGAHDDPRMLRSPPYIRLLFKTIKIPQNL